MILLLFNVITLNNNQDENTRFSFNSYKCQDWDLEHIHSVKSLLPIQLKEKKEWIHENKDAIKDHNLTRRIQSILDVGDDEEVDKVIDEILNCFAENNQHQDINNISNIAMLDAVTNRAYKNAVFSSKRKTIIQKDKDGVFIPQCTKNAFLKFYNDDVDQMSIWGKVDRERYLENIKEILEEYLTKEAK